MGRTWIKIYPDKTLNGFSSLEEKGCWYTLLELCGIGVFHNDGEIAAIKNMGFMDAQLADLMRTDLKTWLKYKITFIERKMISVKPDNTIKITNWRRYQSEYSRQKPFRDLKEVNNIIKELYKETIDYRLEIIESKVTPLVTDKVTRNYVIIFLYWNHSKVKPHLKLTPEMCKGAESALKLHELKDVIQAICNYGKVVNSDCYRWNYRWTLQEFLGRKVDNVERFKDWEVVHNNYLDKKKRDDYTLGRGKFD